MADRSNGRDGRVARSSTFDIGTIARAAAGAALRANSANRRGEPKRLGAPGDFFGPGQPVAPAAQTEAIGRQLDYPTNINAVYQPRSTEPVSFPELRSLAEYSLVRLALETRKDQMGKIEWTINRKDGGEPDAMAKQIQDALEEPDGINDFSTWQRMLLEEVLVTDATAVYLRPTIGGAALLEPIDGALIKPVIDAGGREPVTGTAYQQRIKGLPAVNYTRDELVYYPRNRRVHKLYGYSPVEQIIMIINIGLRREVSQLEAYTEGNIPEMLMGVPKEWSESQIASYQAYFDELLAGDTAARRRIRFVPGDAKPMPVRVESIFDPFDEWLARVVCYAFSLPPSAFTKQTNRATADTAQQVALEEGLAPIMLWFERLMTRLIRKAWKTTDYVFAWQDEQDVDPLVQAQIDVLYSGGAAGTGPKIRSVQEIRDDHDWGPLPSELQAEQDQKQEMAQLALETAKNPPPPPGPNDDQQQQQQQDKKDSKAQAKKIAGALDHVAERLGKLEQLAAVPPAVPDPQPTTSPAQDYAALVEHGVPPNAAAKLAGIDVPAIADGDTPLVKASLVPLAVATDPRSLAPAPAPRVEKLEKKAPPAPPAPAPVVVPAPDVHVDVHLGDTTIAVAKDGSRTITMTKPNGETVTALVEEK